MKFNDLNSDSAVNVGLQLEGVQTAQHSWSTLLFLKYILWDCELEVSCVIGTWYFQKEKNKVNYSSVCSLLFTKQSFSYLIICRTIDEQQIFTKILNSEICHIYISNLNCFTCHQLGTFITLNIKNRISKIQNETM